jgi:hypothetical protein
MWPGSSEEGEGGGVAEVPCVLESMVEESVGGSEEQDKVPPSFDDSFRWRAEQSALDAAIVLPMLI